MERAKLSLKWLEVFQAVARGGSVQDAAQRLGLSVSTVSHHLSCLEAEIGMVLVDRQRRPMKLTPAGETLLHRVDEALALLRRGVAEVWSIEPGILLRRLAVASIEDLDLEVTPFLAARVTRSLPGCAISFLSRPSHEIISMLQAEEIDIGIAATADMAETRLTETPLLRDPYVLIAPRGRSAPPDAYLSGTTGLAFLRYSRKQLIGQRVELQLRRLRRDLPQRLEFESTQTILALIADGQAWTVTTALNYSCGYRHHDRITAMALPDAGFARHLSLFARDNLPESLMTMVDGELRSLIQSRIIAPAVALAPWLAEDFRLLSD